MISDQPTPTVHRRVRSLRSAPSPVMLAAALIIGLVVATPAVPTARAGGVTTFSVEAAYHYITGDGWLPGVTVEVTVDRPTTPESPDSTDRFRVGTDLEFDGSLSSSTKAGDVVTVRELAPGGVTKTLVISSVRVTDADEGEDTISGFAAPGATVEAWIDHLEPSTKKQTTANGSGRWTIDFTGTSDLIDLTTMRVRELDDDGDGTELYVPFPVDPDYDHDGVLNTVDNCWNVRNATQYDGDGDGVGTRCDDVDRISGPNRYATAAAVSEMAFDEADSVLIALGTNFPDALVAAAVGGHERMPVLLTGKDSLPVETIAEIGRLHPTTAYIVGGTAVISPSVERRLGGLVTTVRRLGGATRYETATAVSTTFYPTADRVFIAFGENFPDALVAASPAGRMGYPVLLSGREHVPDVTLAEIGRLHATTIYVVGGTAVISETAEAELASLGTVVRLGGADRFETAEAVADRFYGTCGDKTFLAYGGNFPDALVAAAAAGLLHSPVLLVQHHSIPAPTRRALDDPPKRHDWLVGGTAVIGDDVFDALP